MRLLAFTLLAIAAAVGIHWALEELPAIAGATMHGIIYASHLLLPMIATAALAYAMRLSNVIYVYFAVILSPFASALLIVGFSLFVLHDNLL